MTTEYKIVSDDSGHDYVIPLEKDKEWWDVVMNDPDCEVPDWAERIDGGSVIFPSYRIG